MSLDSSRLDQSSPAQARRRPWLLAGLALLAVLAAWVWRGQQQKSATASEAPALAASSASAPASAFAGRGAGRAQPVTVGEAQRRDLRISVSAIGSIVPTNLAVVRTRVDGELKALYFKEGQAVRAGQVLALIDPQPFQIAVNQAQGVLTRDQAQLRNAQLDLQRYRDLVLKEAAPKQQLDTQEALVQQLQGTVISDQAALDNAKLQLGYTKVLAPISGLAGLKQADLGNIVHAADANGLLSIAQTQPAAVVFAVPDARLPRIREQLQAQVALPVQAWDREQKKMLAQGRVASTDNSIDSTTGTIKVKALFPNADNSLFPNQFVNVRLLLDTLNQVLAVPTAAIQRGAPGSYVYLLNASGTVSLRPVTIQASDGDWTAVQAEIAPGDKVVTDGADRLREGAKVEVISAKARDGRAEGKGRSAHQRAGAESAASAPASSAGR